MSSQPQLPAGRAFRGRGLAYVALWQLLLARWRSFFREPSAIFWTFGFPLLLALALGVAFRSRPPEPLPVAVEAGPGAERLIQALGRRPELRARLLARDAASLALRRGKVVLVINHDASRSERAYRFDRQRPEAQLARLLVDDILQRAEGRRDRTLVREVPVTARGARYIDFLVPGLLGLSLMQSGLWGIGFVLVDLRTRKLIKRMMATPMRRTDFLFAFVGLRAGFLVLELPVLLGFAYLVFDVRAQGPLWLVGLLSVQGALTFCGLGLLLASRAENTQTVAGLINLVSIPMLIASGVFFSAERFPDAVQPVLQLLPLTALNDALRAVMNEGAGILQVARPLGVLLAWGVLGFGLALRLFRWR